MLDFGHLGGGPTGEEVEALKSSALRALSWACGPSAGGGGASAFWCFLQTWASGEDGWWHAGFLWLGMLSR